MKIKLEVLDLTGVTVESHEIEYNPKEYQNFNKHYNTILTIGDYHYMIKNDGKSLERLEPLDVEEELTAIADWLKSKTGKDVIKKSKFKTNEVEKLIDRMKEIDPKDLNKPFDI